MFTSDYVLRGHTVLQVSEGYWRMAVQRDRHQDKFKEKH